MQGARPRRFLSAALVALGALVCQLVLTAPALAAEEGGYQPYNPGTGGAEVSAPLFVVIAYSAIWLVLVVFIASVFRRQRRLEAEIDQLRRGLGPSGGIGG